MINKDHIFTEKEIQSMFNNAGYSAVTCIVFLIAEILIGKPENIHNVSDFFRQIVFLLGSALSAYNAVMFNGRAMIAIMNKITKKDI
jgi:hypothetical protein